MKNPITGVLVDVDNEIAEVKTLDGSLDAYYKALNCECIDMATRKIGKRWKSFNIVCDDEGLFKQMPKISAISDLGEVMLVGNLFITGPADEEGSLTSLNDEDAKYVMGYIEKQSTHKYPKAYPMLHQCRY